MKSILARIAIILEETILEIGDGNFSFELLEP